MSEHLPVPYSFETEDLPKSVGQPSPGKYQCVHFTLTNDMEASWLLNKIHQWFAGRGEIILVDHGRSAKGLAFIVMEWEEVEIDPLFLAILEHEDSVDDYGVYERDMEDYN